MAALAKPFSYTLSDYNAKEDKIAPILMILTITHLGDKAKIFTAEGIFNDKKTAVKITGNSKANSMLSGTFKKKRLPHAHCSRRRQNYSVDKNS